jgi:hypothetical protein
MNYKAGTRKLLMIVFALQLPFLCLAQVNLLFNAAANGSDLKGLSTVQFISNFSETVTGNLGIDVRNSNGEIVVQLAIPGVDIRPGNNFLSPSRFSNASVVYSGGDQGGFARQSGLLPEGELEYCFKLVLSSKNNAGEIYENCFTGSNIISTPLQLVMPYTGDVTCEKRPRFSWQPPMPMRTGTRFTLKLVKVDSGQNAAEAIVSATPLIYRLNLQGFTMAYPAGTADLKEGGHYAWQVIADEKGRKSVSEIWEFTVQCNDQAKDEGSYRELKASDDGGFLSTGNILRFAVYNAYMPGTLQYDITNLGDRNRKIKYLPHVLLEKGENRIALDLDRIPGINEESEYQLSVVLPDGKRISVRFKYKSQ